MVKEKLKSFIHAALAACNRADDRSGIQHVFLVDIHLKGTFPTGRAEVLVDTDTGISVSECLSVNRCLNSAFEEDEEMKRLIGDEFEITVSSPGIGEPIKHVRQYIRHIGHLLRVQYTDDGHAVQEVLGRLLRAEVLETSCPSIDLEPVAAGKGNNTVRHEPIRLELGSIDRAVVEVEF